MRLFFATDIHGSETCWRKFLRCAEFYEADVLVLGGDMTGKALAPIAEHEPGRFSTYLQDQRHDFDASELERYDRTIRERGFYPIRVTVDELAELQRSPQLVERRFFAEVLATVERWVALADEQLGSSPVRCFVCPGNDDPVAIDEVLATSTRLEVGEGRVLALDGGYELVSTGWTNRTPWDTYREEDEANLAQRIAKMLDRATAPPERLLFNFHCPPHGTSLDEAAALDANLQVRDGGQSMAHVGSTAVREAVEGVQPILSLHGHIHESRAAVRIGRTLSVNPGSAYEQGVLHGCIVQVDGKRKLKRYQLTVG